MAGPLSKLAGPLPNHIFKPSLARPFAMSASTHTTLTLPSGQAVKTPTGLFSELALLLQPPPPFRAPFQLPQSLTPSSTLSPLPFPRLCSHSRQ